MLGFIPVGDLGTATLINRNSGDTHLFSCFNSFKEMHDLILSDNFRVTREGYLTQVSYSDILVNISTKTPVKLVDFLNDFRLQILILNTLDEAGASHATLLRFICDANNLGQTNLLTSELYKYYTTNTFPSHYNITNLCDAVKSKLVTTPEFFHAFLAPDYDYHWTFM